MPYSKPEPGKPILIEIAGELREIRFTLRTLKELANEKSISVLKGEALGNVFSDPDKMAVMLYYGLRKTNPQITEDWVEDNVDASMLLDLAPVLAYATTGRWPDMSALLPNDAPRATPTGSNSGLSDGTTSVLATPNSGT